MEKDDTRLTIEQLAKRWPAISIGTLKNWRRTGHGPRYIRVGRKVMYRLEDVVTYEREHTFVSTAEEAARR